MQLRWNRDRERDQAMRKGWNERNSLQWEQPARGLEAEHEEDKQRRGPEEIALTLQRAATPCKVVDSGQRVASNPPRDTKLLWHFGIALRLCIQVCVCVCAPAVASSSFAFGAFVLFIYLWAMGTVCVETVGHSVWDTYNDIFHLYMSVCWCVCVCVRVCPLSLSERRLLFSYVMSDSALKSSLVQGLNSY